MTLTLIALVALLLLPGLLVVRAPWTVVPALSLAFWTLSVWWPPFAGLARGRAIAALLFCCALLLLLRLLPKHKVPPPPGWTPPPLPEQEPPPSQRTPRLVSAPALAILVVGFSLLAATPLWRHAPGPGMAFQTTSARLLLWRDGVPLSAEPLLPLAPFGAHAPALATLAADLSALSGSDPACSVLVVFVAASALLLLGLFSFEAIWLPPPGAALGALAGLVAAEALDSLSLWGRGEAALSLGFVLPASALLLGRFSRSSAVAASLLFSAGLLAQPLVAVAAWLGCAAVLLGRRGSRRPRGRLGRLALVSVVTVALAGPGLLPALRAVSARELRIILSPPLRDLATFLGGVVAVLAAGFLASRLARTGRTRATLAAGLAAGTLLSLLVHWRIATAQLPVARQEALMRAAARSGPLEAVCASPTLLDWVPALAGRAAGEPGPWIPAVYRDEWAARVRRPCRTWLGAP